MPSDWAQKTEALRYNRGPRASSPDAGLAQASGVGAIAPMLASIARHLTTGMWGSVGFSPTMWSPAVSLPVQVRTVLQESSLACCPQAVQSPHSLGQGHQEALLPRPGEAQSTEDQGTHVGQ